jgi:hypothetical protein
MNDVGLRRVTVFGAGVAGLTAAHELITRGFAVQVVDCAQALDADGRPRLASGGVARTQHRRAPLPVLRGALEQAARGGWTAVGSDPCDTPSRWTLPTAPDGALEPASRARLVELAALLAGPLARYRVRLRGPAPAQAEAAAALPAAQAGPLDGAALTVELQAAALPGEHGYRFFPAFYRHMADTLGRVPHGEGRTLRDRLRPVGEQMVALAGRPPWSFRRTPAASWSALWHELREQNVALGVTDADLLWGALRVLRYATSCVERRRDRYEHISWWDFLTAADPDLDPSGPRLPLSEVCRGLLQHSPQALVAMDSVHCDARTLGNVWLQMVLDQVRASGAVDAMLDDHTSAALFDPWQAHLAHLGVRFFHAALEPLPAPEGSPRRITPRLTALHPGGLDGYEPDADYYVLAVDLVAQQRLTREVAAWARRVGVDVGEMGELEAFVGTVPVAPGSADVEARDPERGCGRQPWDRLQTMTGVQLFFGQRVELSSCYLYAADSPWGLSAIAHSARWRRALSLRHDGCVSLLSVDIGDARRADAEGLTVWDCAREEVARRCWSQLGACMSGAGMHLPSPLWFHVDEMLEEEGGVVARNRYPYLVNVVGEWPHRPGVDPVDPARAERSPGEATAAWWRAAGGGQRLLLDQWVMIGAWQRTFTRLTSMEAANESARHGVNTILLHVSEALGAQGHAPAPTPSGFHHPTLRLSTAAGDLCPIWDPERLEPPELHLLREVDRRLHARGLPHLMGILKLDELVAQGEAGDPLVALLERLRDAVEGELLVSVVDRGLLREGLGELQRWLI